MLRVFFVVFANRCKLFQPKVLISSSIDQGCIYNEEKLTAQRSARELGKGSTPNCQPVWKRTWFLQADGGALNTRRHGFETGSKYSVWTLAVWLAKSFRFPSAMAQLPPGPWMILLLLAQELWYSNIIRCGKNNISTHIVLGMELLDWWPVFECCAESLSNRFSQCYLALEIHP
jgi:hypothetical protein